MYFQQRKAMNEAANVKILKKIEFLIPFSVIVETRIITIHIRKSATKQELQNKDMNCMHEIIKTNQIKPTPERKDLPDMLKGFLLHRRHSCC